MKKNTEVLRAELHRVCGGISYLKIPEFKNALKIFHEAVKLEPSNSALLEETYVDVQKAIENFWEVWNSDSFSE